VLDHSVPLHSGYSFRTLAILREQVARGWDPSGLTTPKQGPREADEETVSGIRFFRTPPRAGGGSRIPGWEEVVLMRDVEARLDGRVQAGRPDILHAHSPVLTAFPALRVGKRRGVPVVYEVRAFWEDAAADHGTSRAGGPRYRLTRALETRALRRADAVTAICEGLRGDIVARGIPETKVTVIPNAVDVTRFTPGGAGDPELRRSLSLDGKRVIGFLGSFYGYEGLDVLLRAVPRLASEDPDLRVLLAGGGPEDARLRALAASLKIEDRVRFLGRVPHEAVPRYYDLIDLLVYPRLHSRLTDLVTPLKPLEAMAQGRVLMASDVGGHR
jgi:PEP-CTERM/exosortase A-associated glycosyltransferase